MKNTKKQAKRLGFLATQISLIYAIAFVAVIGFSALSMTSCAEPDDGPSVNSIAVTTKPTKTEYEMGESFDKTGLVVTATYSDGTTKDVTGECDIIGFESITKGVKTITVNYKGKITQFTVTVTPLLVSIGVTTQPTKIVYAIGEQLDTTGMVVTALYSDTTIGEITGYTVGAFDSSTAGAKTVDVTYKGKTAIPPITVTVNALNIATPVAFPLAGKYTTAQSVTLTVVPPPPDVTIYYTLDGTDPTAESTEYTAAIDVTGSTTIKAIAIKEGWNNSDILTAIYTFPVAAPTATPAAGTYITAQSVTLSTTTTGADIYYTLDGTTPTATSTKYSAAISISATTTIKAIAVKDDWDDSDVLTAAYTISAPINIAEADKFVDGNISGATTSTGVVQWFKFTSTATSQYIHFQAGTLSAVNMQVYAADGITAVGDSTTFGSTTVYANRTLTNATVYYIKITAYFNGSYKIAFNTTTSAPTTVTIPTTGVTELTSGKWTDIKTIERNDEQWFKFTPTTSPSYIHFLPGTLTNAYAQVYTADGRVQGSRVTFSYASNSNLYSSITGLTSNTAYYFKLTPSSTTDSGTYRVGFNASSSTTPSITLPTEGITQLTNSTWKDSTITRGVEQWFKFTPANASQSIHFLPGTLASLYVQIYDKDGAPVGTRTYLSNSTLSYSRSSLNTANEYFIMAYYATANGAYKIAVSGSTAPAIDLPSSITELTTVNTWYDGNITTAGADQWFKFKATATTQYIHFLPGGTTIPLLSSVYVRLYNDDGTTSDSPSYLSVTTPTISRGSGSALLTVNTTYLIKVTPYYTSGTDSSGSYKIAFSDKVSTPKVIDVPTANVTDLTADIWQDGNITTAGGEQWFKFTATATGNQYIYFQRGTGVDVLSDVNVQLYTADGGLLSGRSNITSSVYTLTNYATRTTTTGDTYYIKVTPYNSTGSTNTKGAYMIGFNTTSGTAPKITLPDASLVTELTNAGTWYNGNITEVGGVQWFKFTATDTNQFIYFLPVVLNDVRILMYTSDGRIVYTSSSGNTATGEYNAYNYANPPVAQNFNKSSLTNGAVYYIRVRPDFTGTSSSSSVTITGTYKIGFAANSTAPTTP